MNKTVLPIFAFAVLFSAAAVRAEGSAASQANNPLANMKALNFQNYYIPEFTTPVPESGNQFWIRYAQPIKIAESSWLMRASLPILSYSTPNEFGLGDFNIFAAWLIPMKNPALSVGIGPQLTAPTATDPFMGTEKWSAGFAHVLFDARSAKFQYGYLLTWQGSFAGEDLRDDVNLAAFQYFAFYQLGKGNYLRMAPICIFDLNDDDYSIPVGLGFGKVIPKGSTVYNIFVEPQFSIINEGGPWPEWQILVGLNLQFLGK